MADTATLDHKLLNVYRQYTILQWITFVKIVKYTTADSRADYSAEYVGHGEPCEVLGYNHL